MKTRLTLKPGQHGTKSPDEYCDALVCAQFRYDPETKQRLKTVELVVERSDWTPPPVKFSNDTLVPLRISARDMATRNKAKEAGGRWNTEKQLWFVPAWAVWGLTKITN
jgi:hypothetical protein